MTLGCLDKIVYGLLDKCSMQDAPMRPADAPNVLLENDSSFEIIIQHKIDLHNKIVMLRKVLLIR